MAVKEAKKEICGKVRIRRVAVSGQSAAHLVSSPRPRTLESILLTGHVPRVTNRPISPLSSPEVPEDTRNTPVHLRDRYATIYSNKDEVDYRELSTDWILDSPYSEVSRLLQRLDKLADSDLIMEILLHYSLVIKGLPDCPSEDLFLAVYLFIEDTFNIQSRLVKCVKIRRYDGKMDVGVVFDSIRMKYEVLKKDELLEGTEVRMVNNFTLTWYERFKGLARP